MHLGRKAIVRHLGLNISKLDSHSISVSH